ncbi:VOC family protein [Thermobifida halotolerans]|uniref:VOC family protein n=1 Tax=Thermobifida halotolerans TaxID=483545 RepID=A0A399G1U3_9ACTN|nr:guanosine polyphosphate pyrophosphohydrolase [Thermobifida halotolerans]UOE17870.1 VOC family protein [Thermobifida halotolerans]
MTALNLVVIYTERLEECRAFYAGLGLDLVAERHGSGPAHYAAVLADGAVVELYPCGDRAATGRLRLGLTVSGAPPEPRTLRDPDGRTVEVRGV